ncbi:MAG: hypothetical protein AAF628_37480 [Planctomycetota bacterium]
MCGTAQPPSELTRFSFVVPNNPAFLGATLGAQAANFDLSSLSIELSNVGIFVVR